MYKGPLTATSIAFVESAPVRSLETGIKAVVEVIAYPGGHFRIDLSRIEGPQNDRLIRQANQLPLNDAAEAKEHLDALVDGLARLAREPERGSADG